MKTLGIVTSNRADWGLLQPLASALRATYNLKIYATGTHLSPQFGLTGVDILNDGFEFLPVDVMVDSDSPTAVSKSMGLAMIGFAEEFRRIKLDGLIVLGDRFEICAAVMAAYNAHIPVFHCQAGDYTPGSLDEGYRSCVSHLSTLLFAGTIGAKLLLEDRMMNAIYTGSLCCVFPAVTASPDYDAIMLYHPAVGGKLAELHMILDSFGPDEKVLVVGGNGDVGGRMMQFLLPYTLSNQFHFVKTIPRKSFISYLKGAKYIIGNSSCGIIEAPSLHITTINVGSRQAFRERAKSIHTVNTAEEIVNAKMWIGTHSYDDFVNPYAKEDTVGEIVSAIDKELNI